MSSYDPPTINSNIFNDSYFTSLDGALTIQTADLRYLKLTGGIVRGETTFSSNLNIIGSLTYNSNVIDLNLIFGITPGTALASKAVILDAGSSITGINNLSYSGAVSGPIINTNSYLLAGSSVLASALTSISPGTAAASKALVLDGSSGVTGIATMGFNSVSGNDMITLTTTSTAARNTIKFVTDNQSWEIGTRGSTASNPTNFYIYNAAYKLLMTPTGDTSILSSTDSTSASTGCLKLTGGLGVAKNISCSGWLDLNRNGSNINITNPGNGGTALIELSASPSNLRLARGYILSLGSAGASIVASGTRDPVCPLDMGQTASNMIISLYNNTSSYYGLSANNSSVQYSSFSAHTWYTSCTNASPINTNTMTLSSGGSLTTSQNVIAGTGLWCKEGFSSLGRTGKGTAVLTGANYGEVYSYNYSTSSYMPTYIGNVMYVSNSTSSVHIGGGINPALYPLTVQGQASTTFSPYGYLSYSGAGNGSSSGVVPVSIYASDRIACSEFNAYSDERLKENVNDIDLVEALLFVNKLKPKTYNWKTDKGNICIGFIAQDVLRLKNTTWNSLVSLSEDKDLKEEIDEDGFIHPEGKRFQLSYQNMIPILHKALAHALDVIKAQEVKIQKNGELINDLLLTVKYLKDKISLL